MGYNTIAIDYTITGKIPANITNQIPSPLPFTPPPSLRLLRRCTLQLSDPSQNHRMSTLAAAYDILALRPTNEKALQHACQSVDCDLISLDLSLRFPFYFKQKTLASALQRGVRMEICYAPGVSNNDGGVSRRNLISNATQMIRATRGRGIIISSEAKKALACRGPADVVNLAAMWGLGQERGVEAIGRDARNVVVQAEMKRRSFRGVIDVIYGGEEPPRPVQKDKSEKNEPTQVKRKAEGLDDEATEVVVSSKPMSKREQKRQAKKARLENVKMQTDKENAGGPPKEKLGLGESTPITSMATGEPG